MHKMMLIVDDNEINLGLLTGIFEDDFTVIPAKDGRTALARLRYYGTKISVVLLDLVMPGMDGFEVLKRMRETPKLLSIPVIVVSAKTDDKDGLEAIRCGAADFVTKPVDPELIRIRVEAAISRSENARLRAKNDYILLQSGKEAQYHTVLESTGTVVIEFDRLDGIYRYDPSISRHIAGRFDERRLWQILMSDMVADIPDVKAMQELVYNIARRQAGSGSMTVKLKTPSGKKQWFRMQVFRQSGETRGADNMILTFNNVNDEVESAERLRYQAERDELTGLYNRTAFFEKAAEVIAAHEPGHYVMTGFDISKFKVINDQYGNAKGDEVLKQIAEVFRVEFEQAGGIAGRISGDNFVNLYPASFLNTGKLEKIVHKVSVLDGTIPPIRYSIGRYLVEDLSLPVSAMYDRADLAKMSVKGRYDVHIAWYDEAMLERLIQEQRIVNEMKPALDSGQFEVWLQPQVNHATKALIGAEALVRWRHPEKGVIAPGAFIPVFERNGFIYELDKYVWRHACELLRRWMDAGHAPLPVSVNISRRDLFQEDLVENITGLVAEHGIPIDMLRLEITESAFAKSTEQVVRVVKQLIDHGFTVEIDDFGSGYSSLNTLKDVPAQILKLDMRFLENSGDSDRGGNVLESVVRMAKWLGMTVIAEGVEKLEQADYLKSIGCTYVQGYLYAKPMPASEYAALAAKSGREEKLLTLETVQNLNNNAFWDPQSMDTLIFNSYVGAATIVEYHEGSIEMLRATEKFMRMVGNEGLSAEDALKLDWAKHFEPESLAAFHEAMNRSVETNEETVLEAVFAHLPGCRKRLYMRVTLRVIATVGDRRLIYCLNESITAQREIEEKERASTGQLQAIMENINGGVAVSILRDGLMQLEFANEQFYAQRGYTKEQYETELANSGQIIHADDREAAIRSASTPEETFSMVYRIVRRDGAVRWLHNNNTMVRLPGYGEPVQLSVSNDITELREAERKEHEVSEQLNAILAALNSGVSGVTMSGGRLSYVFANDSYYSMLGYTREQFEAEVANGLDLIHPDDRKRIDEELAELARSGGSTVFEYRVIRRDGETIHLRVNGSMLTLDGIDGPVSLGVSTDVTDMVRAQERIKATNEQLQFLNDTAGALLAGSNVEEAIDGVLHGIFDYFQGERAYVFENDYERKITVNTYEVCAPGVSGQMDNLQAVSFTAAGFWLRAFKKNRYLLIPDVDTLDGRREEERRLLQTQGIRSLVAVPLLRNGDLIGFVGVDDPHARLSDVEQLRAIGDYIVAMLTRRDLNAQIANEHATLQGMMDDMPGGFARLRVMPDGNLETVYANDSFCQISGLSRQESLFGESREAMKLVHPDDLELVRRTVAEMVSTGEKRSIPFRLRQLSGGYVPLSAFGRATTGDDGAKYINIYCAELPQEEKRQLAIRETIPFVLSAVLGASSDIAFAEDTDFKYICCSPSFVKLTGQADESGVIGKTDFELFPKAVAEKFRRDDMRLLKTGSPALDYVETIPFADGSLRFFKVSKYVLHDTLGNILGIYGTGRDITEERDAYARLKLLTNSIPGGIASYISSPDGIRITYFNEGFCEILGYTHEEYARIAKTGIANLAFEEDAPLIAEKVRAMIHEDKPLDSTHRVHTKGGGYKWVNLRGSVVERHGDVCILNAVLYDVTKRVEAENTLRMSEEQFRIAASLGGRTVTRYDIRTGVYHHQSRYLLDRGFDSRVDNVPQAFIDAGIFAPECIPAYLDFYDKLRQGVSPCSVDIAVRGENGAWRWLREDATVMTDVDGKPSQAVIVFSDITELREKEAIYRKWKQSLMQRPEETYMLFRCNLSKDGSFDSAEGNLLWAAFDPGVTTFNGRTREYANQCVCEDDRREYLAFLNADTLLAGYYRGTRAKALEYREVLSDGSLRWLRLTVELVEYPNSSDIEAFLLYEDVDAAKRDELHTRELAETDPLTGVLNRTAFAQAVGRIIEESALTGNHALLLLDIDAFKTINDTLGHAMGDQVLRDTADTLRGILRHGDLLGRLGGDEFLICLKDIYDDKAIQTKAGQICASLHKSLKLNVQTSTSIGIAVYPRDGTDFETLYRKADAALYRVKAHGKNSFAFFDDSMADEAAASCGADAERG